MWSLSKSIKSGWLLLAFSVFWLFLPSISFASRTMTEEQYSRLSSIMTRQAEISNQLSERLIESEAELQTAKNELDGCRKELTELQAQLNEQREVSERLRNSLEKAEASQKKAEKSFKDYQERMNSKLRTVRRQRNAWQVGAGVLLIALFL